LKDSGLSRLVRIALYPGKDDNRLQHSLS
jgi:hypothetical protein